MRLVVSWLRLFHSGQATSCPLNSHHRANFLQSLWEVSLGIDHEKMLGQWPQTPRLEPTWNQTLSGPDSVSTGSESLDTSQMRKQAGRDESNFPKVHGDWGREAKGEGEDIWAYDCPSMSAGGWLQDSLRIPLWMLRSLL